MTRDKYYVQKQDGYWAVCHIDHDGIPVTDKLFDRRCDARDNCQRRNIWSLNSYDGEGAPRKHI